MRPLECGQNVHCEALIVEVDDQGQNYKSQCLGWHSVVAPWGCIDLEGHSTPEEDIVAWAGYNDHSSADMVMGL